MILEDNVIKIYSTHDEKKSSVLEDLIRTLQNRIYTYMTWIFKNVYIDKLDEIPNKYKIRYHSTINMKPFYVKSSR